MLVKRLLSKNKIERTVEEQRKIWRAHQKTWRAQNRVVEKVITLFGGEVVVVGKKLPRLDGSVMCLDCDKPAQVYDHRDYNKPMEAEPVCYSCNSKRGPGIV